jgi:lysozyme
MNKLFADLSSNNGGVDVFDAKEYRAAGHVLIGLKASEGRTFRDPNHRAWCDAAGSHHVGVIHYHFGRPDDGNTGAQEAEWFLEVTHGLLGKHDYVVYDGERAADGGFGISVPHAADFDKYIQSHTRFRTILYASASVLPGCEHALVGDDKRDWCAAYGDGPDAHAPGHTCVIRQFTDGTQGPDPHSASGVSGVCDMNEMRGKFAAHVLAHAVHV